MLKDKLYHLTDDALDNLHFAVACGLIGCGLEEQVPDFLKGNPNTKLVIIDTLQKVRDSKSGAGKNGMYANDYMISLPKKSPISSPSSASSGRNCKSIVRVGRE